MNTIELLKSKLKEKNGDNISFHDNKIITFLNPYSFLFFRKNLSLFSKFDIIFIDGILLVYLLRLFGIKTPRHSFDMTSLAPLVLQEAIKNDKSIYFIGSKENEITEFLKKIKETFPKIKVAGYRNGYFKNNIDEVLNEINKINPEVVITGMGTPNQEQFLLGLRSKGWTGTGYTCGGFFHQTAKKISYYPKIYDKLNLRWLYRIIDEPKLIRRYAFSYPKSILIFIFDGIKYKLTH